MVNIPKLHLICQQSSFYRTVQPQYGYNSDVTFKSENCALVIFDNNTVQFEGLISLFSPMIEYVSKFYSNNHASESGGTIVGVDSDIFLTGNMLISFASNTAVRDGELRVHLIVSSDLHMLEIYFTNNNAKRSGGAVYLVCNWSHLTYVGNMSVTFVNNDASTGELFVGCSILSSCLCP